MREKALQAIKTQLENIDDKSGYSYVIGLINMAFLMEAITIQEHYEFTKQAILYLTIAERK